MDYIDIAKIIRGSDEKYVSNEKNVISFKNKINENDIDAFLNKFSIYIGSDDADIENNNSDTGINIEDQNVVETMEDKLENNIVEFDNTNIEDQNVIETYNIKEIDDNIEDQNVVEMDNIREIDDNIEDQNVVEGGIDKKMNKKKIKDRKIEDIKIEDDEMEYNGIEDGESDNESNNEIENEIVKEMEYDDKQTEMDELVKQEHSVNKPPKEVKTLQENIEKNAYKNINELVNKYKELLQ